MATNDFAAQITDRAAYTKGWESTAKSSANAAQAFGAKYGDESMSFWLAGWSDKSTGKKKWTSFLDAEEQAPAGVEQEDLPPHVADEASAFLAEVNAAAEAATVAVAEELDEEPVAAEDEEPAEEPVAAISAPEAEDGEDFPTIAAQRDWIDPKAWTKAEVAAARNEIVGRKNNHRAGYNAAKRGEKPFDEVSAKYRDKHGDEAAWDFRNGYREHEAGLACGTAWAKK